MSVHAAHLSTILLMVGCIKTDEPEPDAVSSPDDSTPIGWNYEWSEEGWAEDLSVDEMAEGIQFVVDLIPSFDGLAVTGAYETAMSGHDPNDNCPKYYEGSAGPFWSDECTDSHGNAFFGQVQTHEDFDSYINQYMIEPYFDVYGPLYDPDYDIDDWSEREERAEGISGGGTIDSDGEGFFGFGGHFFYVDVRNQGLEIWNHDVAGSIDWSGGSPDGSWLELELVPWLVVTHIWPRGDGHHREINGSMSNIQGPINTIEFYDVRIVDEVLGSSCGLEPSGQISVRSNAPYWYDVVFDGPDSHDAVTPGELCDGCGTAWYGDVELGQVCLDFGPLLESYVSAGGGGI